MVIATTTSKYTNKWNYSETINKILHNIYNKYFRDSYMTDMNLILHKLCTYFKLI